MTKQSLLQNIPVLFLMAFFLLSGCNSGPDEKTATATTDTINTVAASPAPPAAAFISGTLDTLWITATDFQKLDKSKAVFIFYFGDNDTISVDGWKDKGGGSPFNATPDVRMLKGKKDATLSYGAGTYFGNLVLKNVTALQKKIVDNAATHVIFAPSKLNNHVYYKVFLSKEPHMMVPKTLALIPTGDEANPSPPKVY